MTAFWLFLVKKSMLHQLLSLTQQNRSVTPFRPGLNKEIHSLLRDGVSADKISSQPSSWASVLVFEFLPPFIGKQARD
nr:pyrophosphate--fructose 6-phosphate 1-phosphotransferase subunit alpha [Tanacetum cinerariifolium]